MTRELAIEILKHDIYLDRRDMTYNHNATGIEALEMAIKELESKIDVLDKIRAEIEDLDRFYDNDYFSGNKDAMFKCNDVLQIIEKYRKEQE